MKKYLAALLAATVAISSHAVFAYANNVAQSGNTYGSSRRFHEKLFSFIQQKHEKDNLMISPLSLRCAMCLAIEGAEGETKENLLAACGFDTAQDMETWYNLVKDNIEAMPDKEEVDVLLANSIWTNTSLGTFFKPDYISVVETAFDAEANAEDRDTITGAINEWCDSKTNHKIAEIVTNASETPLLLVNTLYVSSPWQSEFEDYLTERKDFTGVEGVSEKEFLQKTEEFSYYEDGSGQIVRIPLDGNLSMYYVLGDLDFANVEMDDFSEETVHVMVPKIDMETDISSNDIKEFLISEGAVDAFDANANFSNMSDVSVYISDIFQKTRLITDEAGIEAAAATVVEMTDGMLLPQSQESNVKEFIADHPFRFYISLENPNFRFVLFEGQIVG